MDPRPFVYEVSPWREPPGYPHAVTVSAVLADLGGLPEDPDDLTIRRFAAACDAPLAEAEIEPDILFPHPRWASRPWARAEYARFRAWCAEHGWLEATPTPPPAKRRARKPVTA